MSLDTMQKKKKTTIKVLIHNEYKTSFKRGLYASMYLLQCLCLLQEIFLTV